MILNRAKKFNFDRKKLFGRGHSSMNNFSVGMSLLEIERELSTAINSALYSYESKSHESYQCLRMLNKMLPQDLGKILKLVTNKYLV